MKKLYKFMLSLFMVAAMSFSPKTADAACKSVAGMSANYSNKCNAYTFEGSVTTNGCIKYQWKIFSGNTTLATKNGRVITYTFPNNGTYYAKLYITDTCNKCDTFIYKQFSVNCQPCNWAGMDYSYNLKCRTLTYEGKSSSNGCLKYQFYVNNGSTTSTLTPGRTGTYTFPSNGTYTVKMSVKDTCKGCDTFVYKTISVNCNSCDFKPEFGFKVDCRKVKFTAGTVSGASYYWTFGDGSSGSGKDPSHTYVKDGVYKVCLIVTWKDPNSNDYCKKEICREVVVKCGEPCNLKGDFQFYTSGNTVKLFGSSNNGVYYDWSFGDGTTGSGKDLYHVYKKPGTYTVCVKITNKTRKCTIKVCKTIVIVEPCRISGSFTWTKGTTPGSYKFKGITTGGYYYVWSFGDGTNGTGANPSHTYTKPGTYTVCLTIYSKNEKCKIKICKTIVIPAQEKCLLPNGWSQSNNCREFTFEGYKVAGNNGTTYTNPCHKYSWSFGDGSYASGKAVSHKFDKNGTYTVCLKIVDTCKKCDTMICRSVVVNCYDKCNWKSNYPYFSVSDSCTKIAGYIGFNSSNSGCFKYTWKLNGTVISHDRYVKAAIKENGTYDLCCYVKDTCHNCDTVFCASKTITCFKSCNWKSKYPNYTTFSAGAKCLVISAGLNTANGPCIRQYYSIAGSAPSYNGKTYRDFTVSKPGKYIVCIYLVDTCTGCDTTLCKEVTVTGCCNWSGTDFTVTSNNDKCVYTFTGATSSKTCLKYSYAITGGTSGGTVYRYGRVADYAMPANGTYKICYTVTDTCNKCDTTICKTVTITCACAAKAYFVVDSITSAGVMYITNKSTGAGSYSWDFGDSSSSTSSAPGKHAYKTSGGYTICLTVWDANKTCSTTYCVTVKVSKTRGAASSNNINISVPVNVYPNPATSSFTITTMGSAKYEVLDLNGKLIAQGNITNASSINTDGWMNGVYLVRVTNADGVGTTRLMIQK